jgi:hypothetical protein
MEDLAVLLSQTSSLQPFSDQFLPSASSSQSSLPLSQQLQALQSLFPQQLLDSSSLALSSPQHQQQQQQLQYQRQPSPSVSSSSSSSNVKTEPTLTIEQQLLLLEELAKAQSSSSLSTLNPLSALSSINPDTLLASAAFAQPLLSSSALASMNVLPTFQTSMAPLETLSTASEEDQSSFAPPVVEEPPQQQYTTFVPDDPGVSVALREELKRVMKERGLTSKDVVERTGLTRHTTFAGAVTFLSRYIRGTASFSFRLTPFL